MLNTSTDTVIELDSTLVAELSARDSSGSQCLGDRGSSWLCEFKTGEVVM